MKTILTIPCQTRRALSGCLNELLVGTVAESPSDSATAERSSSHPTAYCSVDRVYKLENMLGCVPAEDHLLQNSFVARVYFVGDFITNRLVR